MEMLNQINTKLTQKPLIFFCREAERALGLEKLLQNFYICCVEDSYIVDQLIAHGVQVFCAEKQNINLKTKSTAQLLSEQKVADWLKQIAPNGFYALTFLPTDVISFKIQKLGGQLLDNPYNLNRMFEDKISALEHFKQANVLTPESKVVGIGQISQTDLDDIGFPLVIQLQRGHTGSGTFVVESFNEFENIKKNHLGNLAKISKYIDGIPLTINACITQPNQENGSILLGPMQYQITGHSALTNGKGSTVGNDFTHGARIVAEWKKTGSFEAHKNTLVKFFKYMQSKGYLGLVGVDLILMEDQLYFIEVNARQTANIPLQTKLELAAGITEPMQLINLAIRLGIDISAISHTDLPEINGSQLFLRAKSNNTLIKFELPSGIFRLQSDNSAMEWTHDGPEQKQGVIYLDEASDKPLIKQEDAYALEVSPESGSRLLLLFQRANQSKNQFEELCRIQMLNGVVDASGEIFPWAVEMMMAFESQMV